AFTNATPTILWRHIFQLLRAVWYAKQGVDLHDGIDKIVIQNLKQKCSADFIGNMIALLYKHELHFLQTHAPRFFIEHLFTLIVRGTHDDTENVHYVTALHTNHTVASNEKDQVHKTS